MYNIIHPDTDSFLSYEFLDLQYEGTPTLRSPCTVNFILLKTNKHGNKAWNETYSINTSILTLNDLCSKMHRSQFIEKHGWSIFTPIHHVLQSSILKNLVWIYCVDLLVVCSWPHGRMAEKSPQSPTRRDEQLCLSVANKEGSALPGTRGFISPNKSPALSPFLWSDWSMQSPSWPPEHRPGGW